MASSAPAASGSSDGRAEWLTPDPDVREVAERLAGGSQPIAAPSTSAAASAGHMHWQFVAERLG